ncbi:MAG: hypothetical protein WA510_22925 [Acidobacteriaceae bacterium]
MPYKFLRGDIVRHIGEPLEMVVAQAAEDGTQYLLVQHTADVSAWFSEDELEIVKRASDDETGLRLNYIT